MIDFTPLTWIILSALLALALLDHLADTLTLRALSPILPDRFKGVYDPEAYAKSQEYTRASIQFERVSSAYSMLLFLAMWLFGGFAWWHDVLTSFDIPTWQRGLLFVGGLMFAQSLLNLPFAYYSTFVLEQRFGFNQSSLKTFIVDLIKNTLLSLIIGAPLLACLLWIFGHVTHAWLWALALTTCFSLILIYIAPTWIMPLYNKFTPLEDGELKVAIHAMAQKCQFPLTELSVMDGSKRSTKANAFFSGLGKNKRIALYDTLIASQSKDELVGVLAHEIGHFKCNHVTKHLLVSILQMGLIFWILNLFTQINQAPSQALCQAFGLSTPTVAAGFFFFFILIKPLSTLLSIATNAISRKNEFEADAFAARVQGSAQPLQSALMKLSVKNLSNLTPHPLRIVLSHSHPPVLQRLLALDHLEFNDDLSNLP